MDDFGPEANAWLTGKLTEPGARQPATIGEIWSSEFDAAGLTTMLGSRAPISDARAEYVAGVASATGQSLKDLAAARGTNYDALLPGEQDAFLGSVVDGLPDEQKKRLLPLKDYQARAVEKAQAIEATAADTRSATYGLGGTATGFLAGMIRNAIDPVNLAGLAIGGPAEGGALAAIGREAAIGAGLQAAQEPIIASNRAELGLETNPLGDIASAAGGAAAFSTLFRAGALAIRAGRAGVRRILGKEEIAPAAGLGAPPAASSTPAGATAPPSRRATLASVVGAEDLDAAAHLAERDELIDKTAGGPDPVAARIKIDEAAAALEGGRPPSAPAADPAPIAGGDSLGANWQKPYAPDSIIRPNGDRLAVRPAVVELGDLVVSHTADGTVNGAYPAELQPRDRSSAASRSFIAERAAALQPEFLGATPNAQTGAPVIGPDRIVESGNGRVLMIARAYDRHPERAAAYRVFLQAQGFDVAALKFPVLVRVREGAIADRAAFAREANISPTSGFSAGERAAADAQSLDAHVLSLWRGGEASAAGNAAFIRAFADRVVAPEERPGFVSSDNRLSAEGARRVQAALVAKAYGAPDVISALFEDANATSKSVLGALADNAPIAARLTTAIAEGRVPKEAEISAPLLEGYRLVERARAAGQRVGEAVDQIDLERGAVSPEVRAAVRLFFRDDALRQAAGRELVAERIQAAMGRALEQDSGDMFGFVLTAERNLKASLGEGGLFDEPAPAAAQPAPPTETVFDSAMLKTKFTVAGVFDANAMADFVRTEVQSALDRGAGVNLIAEGKPRPILRVGPLGLIDKNGNGWGTLPLVMQAKGGTDRIVITEKKILPEPDARGSTGVENSPKAAAPEPAIGDVAAASPEKKVLGDPSLAAEAQGVLDTLGDVKVSTDAGEATASVAVKAAEEDAAAADALEACAGGARKAS